jgi:hypothetical protein
LAIGDSCHPFGGWGTHALLERASQVGGIVVELGEFVLHTIEAARWAVAFEGGVSSLVGALKGVFTGYMARASAYSASLIVLRLLAVSGIVIEQETLLALTVGLGDGGRTDGDGHAKHGEAACAVDLLHFLPCGVNKDK